MAYGGRESTEIMSFCLKDRALCLYFCLLLFIHARQAKSAVPRWISVILPNYSYLLSQATTFHISAKVSPFFWAVIGYDVTCSFSSGTQIVAPFPGEYLPCHVRSMALSYLRRILMWLLCYFRTKDYATSTYMSMTHEIKRVPQMTIFV